MTPTSTARRASTHHVCSSCGAGSPKWQGRCPACGEWNSLVEEAVVPRAPAPAGRGVRAAPAVPVPLGEVVLDAALRYGTGLEEWDRVLGGGMVPGALVLLGGDPGVGKSTLALQVAQASGTGKSPALYCAGEESATQLALRAGRTGCGGAEVAVAAETDLDVVLATIEERRPPLAVIDSVQTLQDAAVPGAPGSVSQVRAAVGRLLLCAKATAVPILLVGHVTKEGAIAGPRTLEHMVDVVLYLEGDRHGDHRLLRGVKNRFGAAGELGIFEMTGTGMVEVAAPGRAFLDEASLGISGSVLTVMCEGIRPLAVEVQALTATSAFELPRRTASGFDLGRLHLLLAVLEKRGRVPFAKVDVYVNAAGGIRVTEPSADLAVALAIAGAARDRSVPAGCVVVGEIGLGGELRRVRRLEQRLQEAAALGLDAAIVPAAHPGPFPSGLAVRRVATLADALRWMS